MLAKENSCQEWLYVKFIYFASTILHILFTIMSRKKTITSREAIEDILRFVDEEEEQDDLEELLDEEELGVQDTDVDFICK